jgi:gluconokinase
MLLVLFGPPGVGKSFVGRILAQQYGFHLYDADEDLTPDMMTAIRQENVFTTAMRHRFFQIVVDKVQTLQSDRPNLAVAQALIKESNRQQVQTQLPHAQFVCIEASPENIKQRLYIRNNWISVEYADKIRAMFEPPQLPHHCLDNNGDQQHVQQQIIQLLTKLG